MDIKEMIKNLKVPKAIIKKVFPPKKCVSVLDNNSIEIKALNVIQPFNLPNNIDLGDFDIKAIDPAEYGKLIFDGESINISKDAIDVEELIDSIKVNHKGVTYTYEDIIGGKAGGKTIAMGDEITVVFKMPEDLAKKVTKGKHTLALESDKVPNVEIQFEI